MNKNNIHLIIPVNADNFHEVLFSKHTLGAFKHLNTTVIVRGKDENNKRVVDICGPCVNRCLAEVPYSAYSYAETVNRGIELLAKNNAIANDDLVVFSDSDIIFSQIALLEYLRVHTIDFMDCFLTLPVVENCIGGKHLSEVSNINLWTGVKIKQMTNHTFCTPIVVTQYSIVKKLIKPMDIRYKTDLAREQLIQKLRSVVGLKEINLHDTSSMRFHKDENNPVSFYPYEDLNKDSSLLAADHVSFVERENFGTDYMLNNIQTNSIEVKKNIGDGVIEIIQAPIVHNRVNNNVKETNVIAQDTPFLLYLHNSIKDIISATPLISKLYHEYGQMVTVQFDTNDNFYEQCLLSLYVQKISYVKNFISPDKYNAILTPNFRKPSEFNGSVLACNLDQETLAEKMYWFDFIDVDEKVTLKPFCNKPKTDLTTGLQIGDFVAISSTSSDAISPTCNLNLWLVGKLVNLKTSLAILEAENEQHILNAHEFQNTPGVRVLRKDKLDLAGLINMVQLSSLSICTYTSVQFWVSYGLRKETILLYNEDSQLQDVPSAPWVHTIKLSSKMESLCQQVLSIYR